MATRSTLTINNTTHLYHHWDGGLWGVGLEIAQRLLKPHHDFSSTQDIIDALSQNGNDKGYEHTKHAHLHNDREFHYDIWLLPDGKVTARCMKYPIPTRDFPETQAKPVTAGAWFRTDVAKEMIRIRKYMREHSH